MRVNMWRQHTTSSTCQIVVNCSRRRHAGGAATTRQMGESIMRPLQNESGSMSIVVPDIHIWPAAATEGTVELGLVRILQAQRVVAHGRLGLPTPRPGNVLVHALVDDDPMTFDRPFERQHVTVAVCRQI